MCFKVWSQARPYLKTINQSDYHSGSHDYTQSEKGSGSENLKLNLMFHAVSARVESV